MQDQIKINHSYWPQTRRLTTLLLVSWFTLTFGVLFFARELALFHFFGWPFSFYMAAQGLTLMYVVILGTFSWYSRRIEQSDKNSSEEAR